MFIMFVYLCILMHVYTHTHIYVCNNNNKKEAINLGMGAQKGLKGTKKKRKWYNSVLRKNVLLKYLLKRSYNVLWKQVPWRHKNMTWNLKILSLNLCVIFHPFGLFIFSCCWGSNHRTCWARSLLLDHIPIFCIHDGLL